MTVTSLYRPILQTLGIVAPARPAIEAAAPSAVAGARHERDGA